MNVEQKFKDYIKRSKLGPVAPDAMFMLKKSYFAGVQDCQDGIQKCSREAKLLQNPKASAGYVQQYLKKMRNNLDEFWKSIVDAKKGGK